MRISAATSSAGNAASCAFVAGMVVRIFRPIVEIAPHEIKHTSAQPGELFRMVTGNSGTDWLVCEVGAFTHIAPANHQSASMTRLF